MIQRAIEYAALSRLKVTFRGTSILGPRQCGTSTLAKALRAQHGFDLENPRDLAALAQAQLALEALTGLIVIGEIQRTPDLFPCSVTWSIPDPTSVTKYWPAHPAMSSGSRKNLCSDVWDTTNSAAFGSPLEESLFDP